jgi:hypothetical protein
VIAALTAAEVGSAALVGGFVLGLVLALVLGRRGEPWRLRHVWTLDIARGTPEPPRSRQDDESEPGAVTTQHERSEPS